MKTTFQYSFLRGESQLTKRGSIAASGNYDVMLLVSSWDKRSICVTQGENLFSEYGQLVLFKTRDKQGLRDEHDKLLADFVHRQSIQYQQIEGDSVELKSIWQQLYKSIVSLRRRKARALTVFMDISACPRYYFAALLATCLGTGIVRRIRLFYAEGVYPEHKQDNPERYELFTTGSWNAVPVPGLEGKWDPRKQHMYLASVGFEGAKTYRTIAAADPDRVAILFPDPGYQADYPKCTRQANEELFSRFRVNEARDFVKAHAGDAIAAWKNLSEQKPEHPSEENVYYVCAGTKPHAVALALRAITLEYPALLYNLPTSHKVVDIRPAGQYWSYDIENLSIVGE